MRKAALIKRILCQVLGHQPVTVVDSLKFPIKGSGMAQVNECHLECRRCGATL